MFTNLVRISVSGLSVGLFALMANAQTGTLSVTATRAGRPGGLPCRAWVEAAGRRYFEPSSPGCTPYAKDRSFSCDGAFTLALPAGKAIVHLERGKEYPPVRREVAVEAGRTIDLAVEMEPWVEMHKEGWYSADHHVHFGHDSPATLRQLALADDLNILPVFSYWNEFGKEDWPERPEWPVTRADDTHLVVMNNIEIERLGDEPFASVGALLIFGLNRPIVFAGHTATWPPDVVFQRLARRQSPECITDTDKPLWGGNVVGAALGLFDTVQVCHNHFHRATTMPVCCGMIGPEVEDSPAPWGEDELFLRTNGIYYRWLDCGFRLGVTGGSAIGVMPSPAGYSRTYARLDGPLTVEGFNRAVRAGRTFATSGPMLTITVDGHLPGDVLARTSGREGLRVKAELRAIEAIDAIDVVCNGQVIHSEKLTGEQPAPVLRKTVEIAHRVKRSGWLAARAVFRASDGRLRQAHTSPVYVTLDGKPTASRADAEYMLRWLDRLETISNRPKRYPTPSQRDEALALIQEARRVYGKIARTAAETCGD